MDFSNKIDTQRRTAVYVRISTSMQKTDRQIEELVTFAKEKMKLQTDFESKPPTKCVLSEASNNIYRRYPVPPSYSASTARTE